MAEGYIGGVVTDSYSGNPLFNVKVSFVGYIAYTSFDGSYLITLSEGYSGQITFEKLGYFTAAGMITAGPGYYVTVNANLTPTSVSIKETIWWEGTIASGSHSFYLISFYGINTNGTLAGFQAYYGTYKTAIIYSPGQSRQDDLTTYNVSQFDCLTIIAEDYNASTGQITGIYDAWIQNSII